MRTIAIINQKGGCGKTTTSINLAACLARLGQRTLLVDMDPQGHCAVGLAVPEEQIERTVYDALIEDRDGKPVRIVDAVWQIATDFDLAPSNIRLAAFEQVFAGRLGREDRLKNALEPVSHLYRWCIVDCPPSVGLITFNALRACDEAIVPVETGYFSLHGLAKMMETLEVLREKCGKEILIRILPTLYDTRTKLAREVVAELRNKFKDYLMESTVNFNTKLKEAASFGQPITEYDPGSRGYKDFVNLARELMGHRPIETEPTAMEKMSRPAELVQRAKQLAQLTNVQFGRTAVPMPAPAASAPPTPEPEPMPIDSIPLNPTPARPTPMRLVVDDDALESDGPVIDEIPLAEPQKPSTPPASLNLSSPMKPAASISSTQRPQSFFGGRFTNEVPGPSLAMSSDEEELADNTPHARNRQWPSEEDDTPLSANSSFNKLAAVAPMTDVAPMTAPAPAVVKTTAQKLEEFYGVKQIGDEVIFSVRFDRARKVLIAGDFNNWSPMSTPMVNRGRPGDFWMCLPLPRGRYRYRFVVDGRWTTDPNNTAVEVNQFGELNNVIEVA